MRGQVLDERGWRFDDVGVEPEYPGGGGSHGRKEKGVSGAGHGRAAGALVLHLVAFGFILGGDRRIEILAEDGDTGEAFRFGPGLCFGDGGLERGSGSISFTGFRNDETEGDKVMGVGKGEQVIPVFSVESGERC